MLPLRVRVDLGAMVMKEYSIFPKAPRLKTHHQIGKCLSPGKMLIFKADQSKPNLFGT